MTPSAIDATLLIALAPFAAAALGPWLTSIAGHRAGWILAIVPALLFAHFASMIPDIAHGAVLMAGYDWAPSLGIRYSMRIDGLSLVFALLITGIGTFIVIYSGGYLKGHAQQGRFFSFILLFMGAMLGLVLADDLLALFVFWELTSITSFLLIGFDHTRSAARRAALQALVITGGGGLALLAGFLVLMVATGATSMSDVLAGGDMVRESGVYLPILLLVLGGAFAKSAQVPLHSWLPNAMEAPTPVSAYLHSATMVKAGVYLLMRMNPALGDTALWTTILPIFGGATFLTGMVLAVRNTDLKQILAYTTVASLGLLVLLTGIGTEAAIAGAVAYLIAHALFKGALFMVAGTIDHETGTREIGQLGGLAGKMPITFLAALVACVSMAGLPPMIGFVAKEVLYDGVWLASGVSLALVVAVIGNALMFAVAVILVIKPFFGPRPEMPKSPHEGPISLWAGPVVLGLLSLSGGLAIALVGETFVAPMTSAVAGTAVELHLHLIPSGLKPPVVLTLITIALGLVAVLLFNALRAGIVSVLEGIGWGPDRGFDQLLRSLVFLASGLSDILQPGRMKGYVTITFVVIAASLLVPMWVFGEFPRLHFLVPDAPFYFWAVLAIAAVSLWAVLVAVTRLIAIVTLGIQGTMVAIIFMLYGAPDLSFTQFMVEILSVIILALVMTRFNLSPTDARPFGTRLRDGALAIACGGAFALILISVVEQPFDPRVSEFFADYSRVIAHGRNIVNVIIVDFRALDTLGEIAVVMTAGLAILAVIRLKSRENRGELTRPNLQDGETLKEAALDQ
ncbi:putative monovalent cation/H+ antiporter subunit A [Amorphus orientalis]|uniref:Multicomponent Na+:H+ antiporter subunit A n=1 Tax=Amorphus orientalis TaxID=649198 RepID=A0AAE4ASG8_9HYPH|nr:putative monovalent cation/H+ antiporter subunit A [Amorphus orientalis]MDQ0315102.1 multicomponent Na+:H+ antiporter subunit A [Amorphus orientalis]